MRAVLLGAARVRPPRRLFSVKAESTYERLTATEHVLRRPGMYIAL